MLLMGQLWDVDFLEQMAVSDCIQKAMFQEIKRNIIYDKYFCLSLVDLRCLRQKKALMEK